MTNGSSALLSTSCALTVHHQSVLSNIFLNHDSSSRYTISSVQYNPDSGVLKMFHTQSCLYSETLTMSNVLSCPRSSHHVSYSVLSEITLSQEYLPCSCPWCLPSWPAQPVAHTGQGVHTPQPAPTHADIRGTYGDCEIPLMPYQSLESIIGDIWPQKHHMQRAKCF